MTNSDFEGRGPGLRSNGDSEPPESALSSWKEIAQFLGVSVRTAQLWEKSKGLPISRLGTGKRARIMGSPAKIRDWLNSFESQSAEDPAPWYRRFSNRWWSIALLCAILTVWILAPSWLDPRDGRPMKVEVNEAGLTVSSADGVVRWFRPMRGLAVEWYSKGGDLPQIGRIRRAQAFLFVDVDSDGTEELLFNVVGSGELKAGGELICFDQKGRIRWRFAFGGRKTFQGVPLAGSYLGRDIMAPLPFEDRKLVLATAVHFPRFPTQVVLLDAISGRLVGEYWHPGHVTAVGVDDLDGDGQINDVLICGVNNPGPGLGHPFLARLEVPFEAIGGRRDVFGEPGGKEKRYLLFPPVDIFRSQGLVSFARELQIEPGSDEVMVSVAPYQTAATLYYRFNEALELQAVLPSNAVISEHRRLKNAGVLDHTLSEPEIRSWSDVKAFATAPDGNSPEVEKLWGVPGEVRRP